MNPLLDPNARIVVAHRGDQARHPENTMAAFQSALDVGADALEFDVRMSADGIPVVMHDAELDRTTDVRGTVDSRTIAELGPANAASRYPGHPREPVPTLEEVLDRFREMPLVIEVKEVGAAEATERLVRRFGLTERVVVGSSHEAVTYRLYRTGLACCASTLDAVRLFPSMLLGSRPARGRYQVLSITPVYHGVPIPVRALAAAATKAGVPVHVWTVNDAEEAGRYWRAGVSAILTNDPAALVRVRPR